ncbi:hypothetical protein N7448_000819 [Penicillium atrosanguineum]|uniref:Uncharacterized protein n=1 Tax=Penicillium atrosanguineum TaxID=1132637 RepID=A0A9W9Q5H9_9EURO|nr:uncharacterized protein N7443_004214 [Penicillium atrosanguineum]KAJ5134158.1 hypothetical protein N7526_005523 [Penicillium atrosanguineum]KAJ5149241.1 hypothetical protein N7448_000819 [Penicillium atrosanguineum]KAJ5304554.1 hypothetical protein N7443_004214 [Penicillium atrosanguineum]KAJ5324023.1 hypothetical protein N7476_002623 [Penicillium atrosanguineum]
MRAHLITLLANTILATSITQLSNFTNYVDIENSALRPNGHILLTTFDQGRLYTLNPLSDSPQAELVASLPGATALCGIAAIANDKFAIVGGVRGHYHYTNETVYTVDFSMDAVNPSVHAVARLPNASMLNGLSSMPKQPHIILIGDSRLGAIFRVDTTTGISRLAFKHDLLAAPTNASLPIGVNGLKVVDDYVLFTNSARNIFAHIRVSADGLHFGDVEIVARLDSSSGSDWDDFIVDSAGVAYVAQPDNAIARVMPGGTHSVIAGGGSSEEVKEPTSVQLANGGRSIYVTTRGDGKKVSGQVLEIQLLR